jgi:hypothetical protein
MLFFSWTTKLIMQISNSTTAMSPTIRIKTVPKTSVFGTPHPSRKRPFFATAAFSHTTTYSDCREWFQVLTARRVRDITSPSSWRPASADNKHGAKLPENPASMGLSGQNGLLINGSVAF